MIFLAFPLWLRWLCGKFICPYVAWFDLAARSGGRLANDQFRFDHDFFGELRLSAVRDALEQMFGGQPAHLAQRLFYGRERRIVISRGWNVVEADHRNVLRHTQPGLAQRPDRADGRNVVEREKRGK